MSARECIEVIFPIKCYGRNSSGEKVLTEPVEAEVKVYQHSYIDTGFSSLVTCPHNTGGHGQRCKASHLEKDKVGDGIICPFSFDLPYALETKYKTDQGG